MTQNPCFKNGKDCEKRCVGCKKSCLNYVAWELTHQKEKENLRVKRNETCGSSEYFLSKNEKRNRNRQSKILLDRMSNKTTAPVSFVG